MPKVLNDTATGTWRVTCSDRSNHIFDLDQRLHLRKASRESSRFSTDDVCMRLGSLEKCQVGAPAAFVLEGANFDHWRQTSRVVSIEPLSDPALAGEVQPTEVTPDSEWQEFISGRWLPSEVGSLA